MAPPFVQSSTARNSSNDPLGSTSLENFFSRVLGAQEVFWGLGFPLASQVMLI